MELNKKISEGNFKIGEMYIISSVFLTLFYTHSFIK